MTNPTNLQSLAAESRKAGEAAKKAAAKLAAAEDANYQQALRNRADAAQAWFDSYDHAADIAEVKAAADRLREVLETSELGKALTDFATTNMRAQARWHRAFDHAQLNGQPAPSAEFTYRDARGQQLSERIDFDEYLHRVLGAFVYQVADQIVQAENDQVDQALEDAFASAKPAEPTHWRITSPSGRTETTMIGGTNLRFVKGVAYVDVAHQAIAMFYARKEGFSATPVFEVPEDWTGFVADADWT